MLGGQMVDRYEALRGQALKRDGRSAGLTLFVSHGMATWIEAWKDYMPRTVDHVPANRPSVEIESPIGIQGDLVTALANLAQSFRRREAR